MDQDALRSARPKPRAGVGRRGSIKSGQRALISKIPYALEGVGLHGPYTHPLAFYYMFFPFTEHIVNYCEFEKTSILHEAGSSE